MCKGTEVGAGVGRGCQLRNKCVTRAATRNHLMRGGAVAKAKVNSNSDQVLQVLLPVQN